MKGRQDSRVDQGGSIDAGRARKAIQAQCPEVRPRLVTYLGEGYDSTAFDVDDRWVFRFPKRGDVEAQLLLEGRVLPAIAPESPLPLPVCRYMGRPSPLFPRHFIGYLKLPGQPAISVAAADVPAWVPRLAEFLSWLHSCPTGEPSRLGVVPLDMPALIDERRAEALADLERVQTVAPHAAVDAWRAYLESAAGVRESGGAPVLLHGDLAAEHLLHDPQTLALTGVIDWSEIAIGDAAVDLAALYHWGGPAFADAVLSAYEKPVDEATRSRAQYLAACRGAADVVFGLDTGRPDYVVAGLSALGSCAGPAAGS